MQIKPNRFDVLPDETCDEMDDDDINEDAIQLEKNQKHEEQLFNCDQIFLSVSTTSTH